MSERAPYSRVYWSIVDDPKFATVYDDDHHLATWLRMLTSADALWPASCPVPANARRASVKALADAGLIDVSGSRFRIHGLDAERGRRREAAQTGTKRGPDGTRTVPERVWEPGPKPRRDENETRQDEPTRAYPDGDRDALDVYHELTQFRPWGQWSGDELKVAIRDYGNDTVEAALRAEYTVSGDRDTLWKRTKTRLAKDADRLREEARESRRTRPKPTAAEVEARYVESQRVQAELLRGIAAVKDMP